MKMLAALLMTALLFACAHAPQENDVIAGDLDTPWAIAFLPNGSMLFTERPGRVSLVEDGAQRIIGEISVSEVSESGLHGIAIDPEFEKNGFVYLYYTHERGNRVARFVLEESLKDETILLDGIPAARHHDGGRIKFGPDGMLYISTGDATDPSVAQRIDSLAGKILRMHPDGTVPEDNPFGNLVWSYGHRNPQGLAWDESGAMYASEHGPQRHDEVNRIIRGGNYGWPSVCGEDDAAMDPVRCYAEFTLAPSGIAWHDGALYVTGLRGAQLRRLEIVDGEVVSETVILEGIGRIREVVAHEGSLYVATSNRDGRGVPRPGDDRILKIDPGQSI